LKHCSTGATRCPAKSTIGDNATGTAKSTIGDNATGTAKAAIDGAPSGPALRLRSVDASLAVKSGRQR
jgi:hypothetical protein